MGYKDKRSFKGLEELLQPVYGRDIQVICGLIQQKEVRSLIEESAEEHPHLPAFTQGGNRRRKQISRESKACKDLLGLMGWKLHFQNAHFLV